MRWHSNGTDLILPGAFIPVAEETGLILSIGERVLRTAARRSRVPDGPTGAGVAHERWNGQTPSTGGSRWAVRVFHSHDSNRG